MIENCLIELHIQLGLSRRIAGIVESTDRGQPILARVKYYGRHMIQGVIKPLRNLVKDEGWHVLLFEFRKEYPY